MNGPSPLKDPIRFYQRIFILTLVGNTKDLVQTPSPMKNPHMYGGLITTFENPLRLTSQLQFLFHEKHNTTKAVQLLTYLGI